MSLIYYPQGETTLPTECAIHLILIRVNQRVQLNWTRKKVFVQGSAYIFDVVIYIVTEAV